MTARAVVLDYDHNHAIRTNQRPPRDCRGPGAFFNTIGRTGSSADAPGGNDDDHDSAANGRCDTSCYGGHYTGGDRHQRDRAGSRVHRREDDDP